MTSAPDGDALDRSLEAAVVALRRYVAVARGVRAEFEPDQADLDPRVEEASVSLGLALGTLEDEFEDVIGFVPTIEPMWEGEDLETEDDGPDEEQDGATLLTADAFSLGLVVGVEGSASPDQLDGVIGMVDEAAGALVDRLETQGFVVTEYFVARGEHADGDALGGDGPDRGGSGAGGDGTEEQ